MQPTAPTRNAPDMRHERALMRRGHTLVAGIDEAGRGTWAGPVVAAAVILPGHATRLPALRSVRDSKLLTPRQRDAMFERIRQAAIAVGVGRATHVEIDDFGIVPATRAAMQRAIESLPRAPQALVIDAVKLDVPLPQRVMFHADAVCLSVAAASIIAKVTRDRLMIELDAQYAGYGFAQHKGYGTRQHQLALAELGPCAIHRMTFEPVRNLNQREPVKP